MNEELKPCSCGREPQTIIFCDDLLGWIYKVRCSSCGMMVESLADMEDAIRKWNHRPAEDKLKAELEELRYIVNCFNSWCSEDGCPKHLNPDFPCSAEIEYKNDPDTEGDFDEWDCWKNEADHGCWVEYYRWQYRQQEGK